MTKQQRKKEEEQIQIPPCVAFEVTENLPKSLGKKLKQGEEKMDVKPKNVKTIIINFS